MALVSIVLVPVVVMGVANDCVTLVEGMVTGATTPVVLLFLICDCVCEVVGKPEDDDV